MLIGLIITIVLAFALTIALAAFWFKNAELEQAFASLSEAHDRAILENQQQIDTARAVVPFLAKTSVAMFYGEQNGVQYSFAQRQDIARKVQTQNAALRRFNEVFGIGVEAGMVARAGYGDPEAEAAVEEMRRADHAQSMTQAVQELGPDSDLPPASSNPWSGASG